MTLHEYFSLKGRGSALRLANELGITRSYLSQMASGKSAISPERAIAIELATGGLVTCEALRPDVAWEVLRRPPCHTGCGYAAPPDPLAASGKPLPDHIADVGEMVADLEA